MGIVRARTSISPKVRKEVYERDNYHCVACGRYVGEDRPKNIGHYLSRGCTGAGQLNNLYTICPLCHRLEHDGKLSGARRDNIIAHMSALYPEINYKEMSYEDRKKLKV